MVTATSWDLDLDESGADAAVGRRIEPRKGEMGWRGKEGGACDDFVTSKPFLLTILLSPDKEENHRPKMGSLVLKCTIPNLGLIPELTAALTFPRNVILIGQPGIFWSTSVR